MRWLLAVCAAITLLTVTSCVHRTGDSTSRPTPMCRAHSHNDYERPRPLLEALERGVGSIEADIHLVDGRLLVAHDLIDAKPDRTLETLYLEPLRHRVSRNGRRVSRDGPPLILLVDVKSGAEETYLKLDEALRGFATMLTRIERGRVSTGAVTVIVSGNRARKLMEAQSVRLAAIDGRPADLGNPPPVDLVPLVSADWKPLFAWRGVGEFPSEERRRLRELVARAHMQGRRIRFWGTVDTEAMWRELLDADVDLINTDDLAGLERFLRSRPHR